MTTTATTTDIVTGEIRAILARRRIRQGELAIVAGIPERVMARRLQGRTPFTVDEVAAVAGALEVPVGVLFREGAIR